MKKKLVIAHRGDCSGEYGNTLRAFREAVKKKADMIELDVRKTQDNVLIVFHDRRMNGKFVRKLTWPEIEELNSRNKKEVPRLLDVLKELGGKIKLDVEIKEKGYEEETAKLLIEYMRPSDFVITSFHNSSLSEIKNKFPNIRVGLLLGARSSKGIVPGRNSVISHTAADFFAPHRILVRLGFLWRSKKYNKPSIVWVVNKKKAIEKILKHKNVEGIITDKLGLALAVRNESDE
ncbi:MAG: glycerophosphodiester phosphodiesterase [Parcubacteria group bacterium]